jgi:hypothetical protein
VYWTPAPAPPPPPPIRIEESSRRGLVLETWFVQLAFLVPGVLAAVDVLAARVGGTGDITRFPVIISGHPLGNLVIGIISYFEVAAVVPLAGCSSAKPFPSRASNAAFPSAAAVSPYTFPLALSGNAL